MANQEPEDLKLYKRVCEYLEPHGWEPLDIFMRLGLFRETHGEDKLAAMGRFITWAEEHDKPNMVAATLAHDLYGCRDELMLPRSAGY